MRVDYKVQPVNNPPPGAPNFLWTPVLYASVIYKHAESKRLESIVDSGSPVCLFHADVGRALGMKVEDGRPGPLGGVVGRAKGEVFYHKIKIKVLGSIIETIGGFSPVLSVAAILGRIGFFDNFRILFNPEYDPPGMEIEKVNRA